jgi:hypothetical protein
MIAVTAVFGGVCLTAGVELGGGKPAWWAASAGDGRARSVLGVVLGAPVGWIAFALLVPTAVHGVREGWRMGRDAEADAVHRAIGWGLVGACVAGAVASAALLARTIG